MFLLCELQVHFLDELIRDVTEDAKLNTTRYWTGFLRQEHDEEDPFDLFDKGLIR